MMPDLGEYAVNVLAAYGFGLSVLVLLVLAGWRRSRRARADLDQAERGEHG